MGARDDAPAHGAPLHVLATYPADGQGTDPPAVPRVCNSPTPDCPVPTDVAIELRFDRFLRPGGGLAAGLQVFTGDIANSVSFTPEYDLVERVVVFRSSRRLQPNTLYTAQIVISSDPARGFWAFDRAPLEAGDVPLRFSFSTGSGPSVAAPPQRVAPPDTCETLTTGPLRSCTSCHVTQPGADTIPPSKYPPMGLDLSNARGFFYTAIQHVAHEAETGNTAVDDGLQAPSRFGVQMNVVDPGFPATSYLMYKLLEKPENYRLGDSEATCVTGYHAPVSEGGCRPPAAAELVQLREWFVRGDPMPKDQPASTASLSHSDLLRTAAWIAAGAPCSPPD